MSSLWLAWSIALAGPPPMLTESVYGIVMSSGSQAFSDIWVGTPDDAEYDGVYAAVMATERGRWFLTEYASRNRQTDTHAVLGALARLETAVRSSSAAQASAGAANGTDHAGSADVAAVAERIQDIAFMLRERAVDADLCDALDAAVHEIAGIFGTSSRPPPVDRIEPAAAAPECAINDASFAKARQLDAPGSAPRSPKRRLRATMNRQPSRRRRAMAPITSSRRLAKAGSHLRRLKHPTLAALVHRTARLRVSQGGSAAAAD